MRAIRSMVVIQLLYVCVCVKQSGTVPATQNQQPEEKELLYPSVEELAIVLQNCLTSNFDDVKVSVVDCPDLSEEPFCLAAKGLGGSPTIVEVGSNDYMFPEVNYEKAYDMKDIIQMSGVNPAMVIGAGAGPLTTNMAGEMTANLAYEDGKIHSLTRIFQTSENGKGNNYVSLHERNGKFSIMGNFYISEGLPGKVIKVDCRNRTGNDNFPTAIRKCLVEVYPKQAIGLGGTFLITNSKVRQHVQPAFSDKPLTSQKLIDEWLKFFEMNPPLVAVGTIMTAELGMGLRPYHFHTCSDHNDGGHYYYDLNQETVNYLGYFNVGRRILRFDKPPHTSNFMMSN